MGDYEIHQDTKFLCSVYFSLYFNRSKGERRKEIRTHRQEDLSKSPLDETFYNYTKKN